MSDDRLINVPAEAGLLGAMLLDNNLITEWADRLRPTDFFDAVHGRIYGAMLKYVAAKMQANAITLRTVFQNDKDADYGDYLDVLVESEVVAIGATSFATQIVDLAGRRTARQALRDASEALATEFDRPVADITGAVDEAVWAAESRTEINEAMTLGDMMGRVAARDDRIASDPTSVGMKNTLISDLNTGLGELQTSTYTIVAGRPGMGKSVLVQSAAIGWAAGGNPGVFIATELDDDQASLRVAADASLAMGMPLLHDKIRKGGMSFEERKILDKVRERVELLPLKFVCTGPCDIRRIWSIVARHKAMWRAKGQDLKFVVIDLMGKVGATGEDGRPIENTLQRMNKVSAELERMKKDLDVAVIAVCQLSRGVEGRPDKRPIISDLKESGNLEQDADAVLLIFREEYYLEHTEPKVGAQDNQKRDLHEAWEVDMNACRGKVELIIGKNRHARPVTRTAKFIGKHMAIRGSDTDEVYENMAVEPLLI